MRVTVIGAGVVGACTALALVERGFEVTLIEQRDRVAEVNSHANGGGVTPLHSEPWNGPGLAGSLLKYMGRADAPWRLPPQRLPGLGRWGVRFLAQSRRSPFMANARANIRLGLYSQDRLRDWRDRYAIDYAQTTAGSMQLYFNRAAFDRALAMRRELIDGLGEVEPLDVEAVVAREPALAPVADRLAGGLFYPTHESGDAARFAQGVAEAAGRQGAQVHLGESIRRIVCDKQKLTAVETDRATIKADACVIAAGPATTELLRPLGIRVPIQPVRGYSATFELEDTHALPALPLLDTARRFVTLRLGERGLRIAGLADFAGHRRAIPPARMDVLLNNARELLPALAEQLTPAAGRLWSGLRPVTPDGRPLLGETNIRGLYLNAGHGPMGWTMACGSAQILADLVDGREPALDISDYRADCFGRRAA
ncbi:FAD-dependent oxidoreductase [Wenzhouxiangella sp. EGI_FJ10305]|uniref:FAD-dependent oxidoreductase n=1 Tax=Wenzhouxiangella sp. EGI_FJ10305 TaxID=3243768 RepID=UPI0035DEBFC1